MKRFFLALASAVTVLTRSVGSLVYLPIVLVDERIERINLLRVQRSVATVEANHYVAMIGEILKTNGRSDAGRDCLDSVVRALSPPKVAELGADGRMKPVSLVTKKGDAS